MNVSSLFHFVLNHRYCFNSLQINVITTKSFNDILYFFPQVSLHLPFFTSSLNLIVESYLKPKSRTSTEEDKSWPWNLLHRPESLPSPKTLLVEKTLQWILRSILPPATPHLNLSIKAWTCQILSVIGLCSTWSQLQSWESIRW